MPAPLTPMSCDDFRSPLDDARAEIAALKKAQQFKTDATVLRLQLDNRNYRDFLKRHDLLKEFRAKHPF